jgi:beta-lactam-binding protein with PASTA domain
VTIPQVVGQSQRAATITLQQRGLDNAIAEIDLPGATAGQVIGQDPPANAVDVAAPKVSLLVTQEVSAGDYAMPGFVGRPLGSAMLAIKDAGFSLGTVTFAPPATASGGNSAAAIPAGANPAASASPSANLPPANPVPTAPGVVPSPAAIIVSQDPVPGRKVSLGSEIRFVVR